MAKTPRKREAVRRSTQVERDTYHGLLLDLHKACEQDGNLFVEEMSWLVRAWMIQRSKMTGKKFIPDDRFDDPPEDTPAREILRAMAMYKPPKSGLTKRSKMQFIRAMGLEVNDGDTD